MQIPQYLRENTDVVEVLRTGHFPTTVIVRNTRTNKEYEADLQRLSTLENQNIRSL